MKEGVFSRTHSIGPPRLLKNETAKYLGLVLNAIMVNSNAATHSFFEGSYLAGIFPFIERGSQLNIFGKIFPAVRYGYFDESNPPYLKVQQGWS